MNILSNDQLYRIAPSIFAQSADEARSDKYRFVPTIEVLDTLRSEGFQPVRVTTSRSLTEEGKSYVKHHIRLRRDADLQTKLARVGQVIPEIALTNSHNGTSGFILDAALHRLVCSNGLIAESSQGALRFRHSGKDDLTGRILEGAYSIVKEFPLIADKVEEWSGIGLSDAQRLAFAKAAIPLRFDDETAVSAQQLLTPRRYGDRNTDLFTTFNVVQEHLIKGGVRQGIKNGRRVTTRKVTSVDRDLKLNRALWTLADALAGHVSGAELLAA
jgi:hypothetical protein